MTDQLNSKLGRREFLGAAAVASFTILKPQLVRGTAANSQVRFGILGCGGRATAEGTSFVENAGARVTAIADLFADQLEKGRQHFDDLQQAKGYAPIDSFATLQGSQCLSGNRRLEGSGFHPHYHPALLSSASS